MNYILLKYWRLHKRLTQSW